MGIRRLVLVEEVSKISDSYFVTNGVTNGNLYNNEMHIFLS